MDSAIVWLYMQQSHSGIRFKGRAIDRFQFSWEIGVRCRLDGWWYSVAQLVCLCFAIIWCRRTSLYVHFNIWSVVTFREILFSLPSSPLPVKSVFQSRRPIHEWTSVNDRSRDSSTRRFRFHFLRDCNSVELIINRAAARTSEIL